MPRICNLPSAIPMAQMRQMTSTACTAEGISRISFSHSMFPKKAKISGAKVALFFGNSIWRTREFVILLQNCPSMLHQPTLRNIQCDRKDRTADRSCGSSDRFYGTADRTGGTANRTPRPSAGSSDAATMPARASKKRSQQPTRLFFCVFLSRKEVHPKDLAGKPRFVPRFPSLFLPSLQRKT